VWPEKRFSTEKFYENWPDKKNNHMKKAVTILFEA